MSSLVSNSLLFGRAIWIVSRLLRWQQQHTNAPPRARQCSTSSSSLVGAIAEAYRETALLQYRARRNGGTARRGGQRGWQQSHEPISAQFSALFGRHCALIGRALFFAVVSSRVSWTQSVFVWRLWRQQQQKQPLEDRGCFWEQDHVGFGYSMKFHFSWISTSRGVAYLQNKQVSRVQQPCNCVAKL